MDHEEYGGSLPSAAMATMVPSSMADDDTHLQQAAGVGPEHEQPASGADDGGDGDGDAGAGGAPGVGEARRPTVLATGLAGSLQADFSDFLVSDLEPRAKFIDQSIDSMLAAAKNTEDAAHSQKRAINADIDSLTRMIAHFQHQVHQVGALPDTRRRQC
ncbi:hypothetical protein MNEG_6524 [Monoraphidium neglectum]|uniref:Uncharacterized protein n=1 Tax=Monoraphidium neglectum TaxID=145388 RepID=A0A0D2L2D1_9CHLO|nr:hypothetical protein MNEG_6524 [Monoraphidium neglectum]KIZ01434.1 hypothetical protein MNEG_6524 [Monoraphidium neglectum]|eukprot:XP_013900453.1 hypothetical protein MNEG_6524 [Monoraphidium neglectum]